jgi:hypothetical protein
LNRRDAAGQLHQPRCAAFRHRAASYRRTNRGLAAPDPDLRADRPPPLGRCDRPRILRSGNWFETRLTVQPSRDIADLVVEIDEPLWRAMSIDTLVPDADKVESLDGTFAYSFGPVRKGERFLLKFDGQIQPHWLRRISGHIAIRDGETELAGTPLSIMVLP